MISDIFTALGSTTSEHKHFDLQLPSLHSVCEKTAATCQQSVSLFSSYFLDGNFNQVVSPPPFVCSLFSNIWLLIISALLLIPLKSKPGADSLWLKFLVSPLFFLADTVPLLYVTPTVIAVASKKKSVSSFLNVIKTRRRKRAHKIEILLLFTFQYSVRGKKQKAFHPCASLILTTPQEARKWWEPLFLLRWRKHWKTQKGYISCWRWHTVIGSLEFSDSGSSTFLNSSNGFVMSALLLIATGS